jgi:hypothetical protein
MAKASKTSKAEVKEVEVQKIDNRISLVSILEQVSEKAGTQARSRSASSATKDRATRIKELSAELAQEIRELRKEPASQSAKKARSGVDFALLVEPAGIRSHDLLNPSKYPRPPIPAG